MPMGRILLFTQQSHPYILAADAQMSGPPHTYGLYGLSDSLSCRISPLLRQIPIE